MRTIIDPQEFSPDEYNLVGQPSADFQQKIISLQRQLIAQLDDAIWLTPSHALHLTVIEITGTHTQPISERAARYTEWYDAYHQITADTARSFPGFSLHFDQVIVSQRAIIIKARAAGQLNMLRKKLLARTKLPAGSALPPDIAHITLARFSRAIDLADAERAVQDITVDYTEAMTQLALLAGITPPDFAISKIADDPLTDDYPILEFASESAWRDWLEHSHAFSDGIWLRIYKKAASTTTVTYLEALDQALCYGWIDGQRRTYDSQSFLQKYTPRRSRSSWSKRNIEHINRLTKDGKIAPSGLAEVRRAKADGRWDAAYDAGSQMVVPEDFVVALKQNPKAAAFYKTLSKSDLYSIGFRLQTAKKPQTRARRLAAVITVLAKGQRP